jgi:DTW domain
MSFTDPTTTTSTATVIPEKMKNEAEDCLLNYLEVTHPPQQQPWPRVFCCNSSRSLYCPECCQILIPQKDWPSDIRNGTLALPFDVDIILHAQERRTSSSGLHLVAISSAMSKDTKLINRDPTTISETADHVSSMDQQLKSLALEETAIDRDLLDETPQQQLPLQATHDTVSKTVRLYDLQRDAWPQYDDDAAGDNSINTYVLYPSKDSMAITDVPEPVHKLIVLDCKWGYTAVRRNPSIVHFRNVHLASPPAESQFWRWHTAGKGMLSTAEAVYYAAWEVASTCTRSNQSNVTGQHSHPSDYPPRLEWSAQQRQRLVQFMWLFSLQRSAITKRSIAEERPLPFSEQGKAYQRELRRKQAHDKQNGKSTGI